MSKITIVNDGPDKVRVSIWEYEYYGDKVDSSTERYYIDLAPGQECSEEVNHGQKIEIEAGEVEWV